MRICVLTTSYPRHLGDHAGAFLEPLNEGLARFHGHEIAVVAPHDDEAQLHEVRGAVTVRRFRYFLPAKLQRLAYGAGIPANFRSSLLARAQVPGFIACFAGAAARPVWQCDLVHAHWFEAGLLGLCLSRLKNIPLVLSVHRFVPSRLNLLLYRHVLTGAAAVIFNSSFTLRQAQSYGVQFRGMVVPLGADTAVFTPSGPNLRSRYSIPSDAVVIGSLGRMVPKKGHAYLVEAFHSVLAAESKAVLLLGGDGPLKDDLASRMHRAGISERVRLVGNVERSEVPNFMRSCDVFCLPSVVDEHGDTETLGVVLVEAMACGVPCVASRVGGIVDSVVDGETGLLVEQKDVNGLCRALMRMIGDGNLRRRMVASAHAQIDALFSWRTICSQVNEAYASAAHAVS